MDHSEWTDEGFDMVMDKEGKGWLCSLYRERGRIPLARKLLPTQLDGQKWFIREKKRFNKTTNA